MNKNYNCGPFTYKMLTLYALMHNLNKFNRELGRSHFKSTIYKIVRRLMQNLC